MTEADKLAAADAESLRANPVFAAAILSIRRGALEELAAVQPTEVEAIRTIQARIRAIDLLATEIAKVIIKGTPQRNLSVA